jgi:hypothetical protein
MRGHGSGSGARFPGLLFHVRRGSVVEQEDFASREEALAAAGVRE